MRTALPRRFHMRDSRLSACLLALLLLVAPLAVAALTVEEAFLLSLARDVPEEAEDPLAGVGTPDPVNRTCTISRDCGDGNVASCSGTYSCEYSQRGVTCNGTEYACPNYCSMGWTCQDCPSYSFFCWSLRGDCGVTADGCDGRPQRCRCPFTPEY
jgi:hypothetical protein